MPEQPENPIVSEDRDAVINALLIAVRRAAENSAGADDARESKELGGAALAFAQAAAILDPTRLQGGDTPAARVAATPPQMPGTRDGDRDGQIGER